MIGRYSKIRMWVTVYVLVSTLIPVSQCQKMSFPDRPKVNVADDSDDHYGNWSLDGSVQLTPSDLIMFEPLVRIQTCSPLCDVDLLDCPPQRSPESSNTCYCKEKTNDKYKIHIGSEAKPEQSQMLVTATIPSRRMFDSVAGSAVVGTLPCIARKTARVEASYRLDDRPSQELLPEQVLTVCPDKVHSLRICVKNKSPGSVLKLSLKEQETSTHLSCIDITKRFESRVLSSNNIIFTYEEEHVCLKKNTFVLNLKEGKPACLAPTLSRKPTSRRSKEMDAEFFDIFSNGSKEWRLAFRGSSGTNTSVYEAYMHPQNISVEPGCTEIYTREPCSCTNHYRNNDVLDNWDNVHQVAFVVFEGVQRVAHVVFDAAGSDSESWLAHDRVVTSSWSDIKLETSNYFSIRGDDRYGLPTVRGFFMNHHYGGCPGDNGWFAAVDRKNTGCVWNNFPTFPTYLYAKKNSTTNWTSGDVGIADFIAIFVKYNPESLESEFFDVFGSQTREWRLAFRGVSGNNESVLDAYRNKQNISVERGCRQLVSSQSCTHHFRNNDLFDNWAQIKEVAFVAYKNDKMAAFTVFDAVGSDSQSWFRQHRVITASWYELKSKESNLFSIHGNELLGHLSARHFFMSHVYGGCGGDSGWFVAVDVANLGCPWDYKTSYPTFLYATKGVATKWATGDVGIADFIAILVKYF